MNYCLTISCPSFGIASSVSYRYLENNEVLCVECGRSFYLLPNDDLSHYKLSQHIDFHKSMKNCSRCHDKNKIIRFGFSINDKQRYKCLSCGHTFSDVSRRIHHYDYIESSILNGDGLSLIKSKYNFCNKKLSRTIKQISKVSKNYSSIILDDQAENISICTDVMLLPYGNSKNKLYLIVSSCVHTGRVILVTGNYFQNGNSLTEGRYIGEKVENSFLFNKLDSIHVKEQDIMNRNRFYNIDYGTSILRKNEGGCIVKPVLTSYSHFELLYQLTEKYEKIHHIICHESFIYASCLSAYSDFVKNNRCGIFYYTNISKGNKGKLDLNNYWRDTWYTSSTFGWCDLTKTLKFDMSENSMKSCRNFIEYIKEHPFYEQLVKLNAGNASSVIDMISFQYNRDLIFGK